MPALPILIKILPYAVAAAVTAAMLAGKLDPELAAVLLVMLGIPSPVQHAVKALAPMAPKPPEGDK